MGEWGILSFLYRVLRDFLSWAVPKKRSLSPADCLRAREKWKAEFEERILDRRRAGLRSDVIVRDVKRMDDYPDTNESHKGISPWFRVGLVDTYHKGIMLQMNWVGLVWDEKKESWITREASSSEKSTVTAALIGYVPYENIESVDWEGDEYYSFPHIFCHFDSKRKEPYERLGYCEQKDLNGHIYYTEIVDYDTVRKNSRHYRRRGYA